MKSKSLLLAFVAALFVLPACNSGQQKTDESQQQNDSINSVLSDSLATAMAERDTLMALMNDISDGMSQIKRVENIVSQGNLSGETADKKRQLRADVVAIQQSLQERSKRLDQLEARLSKSANYNDEMKKTIKSLKQQIADQQAMITDLTQQLAAAHIVINNLNTRVDSLNTVNTAVNQEKAKAQEESVRLANQLNECYYVVGSKNELKQHKIIETGFLRHTKVMEGDFATSYFTKADKRTLSVIPLHNSKAQVLSKHPAGSYTIADEGGQKVLKILNPTRFWELSNYLVVKVG